MTRTIIFTVTVGQTTYTLEKEVVPVPARGKRKATTNTVWYLNGTKRDHYFAEEESTRKLLEHWCASAELARVSRAEYAARDATFRTATGITDNRFEPNTNGDVNVDLSLSLTVAQATELFDLLTSWGKTR